MLPEDGQEQRPEHVGTPFSKNIVQKFGINYCICNRVARKMLHIKFEFQLTYAKKTDDSEQLREFLSTYSLQK